jgi:hypothetical protein
MSMRLTGDDPPELEYFTFDPVEELRLSADGSTLTIVQRADAGRTAEDDVRLRQGPEDGRHRRRTSL